MAPFWPSHAIMISSSLVGVVLFAKFNGSQIKNVLNESATFKGIFAYQLFRGLVAYRLANFQKKLSAHSEEETPSSAPVLSKAEYSAKVKACNVALGIKSRSAHIFCTEM